MKKLYSGGTILTGEAGKTAGAVLTEDGVIRAVGEAETLKRQNPDACEADLGGAVLIPGFIDPHSHFSQVAGGFLQVSLAGADTPEEIAARIRRFDRENGGSRDGFLLARDYDNERLPGSRHLPLAFLDSIVPGRRLVIQHQSGHMGLFSSAALSALGITAATPDPAGGKIGREAGALTGYLEENAYFPALKKVPMPGTEELLGAYRRAQEKYASYGITTVQEGLFVTAMLPMFRALADSGLLRLDLVAYAEPDAYSAAAQAFPQSVGQYDRHLKLGGLKIFLDGSPQGRTAWMRTPYAGEAAYRGYGTLDDAAVKAALETAAQQHLQLLAHCNGDAAAEQLLNCLDDCEKRFPVLGTLRPVLIHGQLLGRDQLAQAARLHLLVSFFVAHVFHWGDVHVRNFGEARARQISPLRSALEHHVSFTLHQDAPVIEPDMAETLWCAVNRRTKSGLLLGGDECIPVGEALKAVTLSAAYQYFEENTKGSIRPGKKADFAVLDRNPLTVPADELKALRVLETVKDGETIWKA